MKSLKTSRQGFGSHFNRTHWIQISCFLLFAFLQSSCGPRAPRPYRISVVLLNFAEFPSLPLPKEAYEQFFFSQDPHYQRTPKGRPLAGSVKQWFLRQSGGLTRVEGQVFGPFQSTQSWNAVYRNPPSAGSSSSGTPRPADEWFERLVQEARQALQSVSPQLLRTTYTVVIHNAPVSGRAGGTAMVEAGIDPRFPDDLPPLGVSTHELGHIFFGQPDRYQTYWGNQRTWDNMADAYTDAPAGYSALGRITAEWSTWGPWFLPQTQTWESRPLAELAEIPRFRQSLDGDPQHEHFFTLEYRSKRSGTPEAQLDLPQEGVLFVEYDNYASRIQDVTTAGTTESIPSIYPAAVTIHRPLKSFLSREDTYMFWALPQSNLDPARPITLALPETSPQRTGWNCRMGTSLNVWGECLWEIENVTVAREDADPRASAQAIYKVQSFIPQQTQISVTQMGRPKRLYIKHKGLLSLIFRSREGRWVENFETNPRDTSIQTSIFDLDALREGGTIEIHRASSAEILSLDMVERTLATPQRRPGHLHALLPGGVHWHTALATAPGDLGSTAAVPLAPLLGQGEAFANGTVRLMLAHTAPLGAQRGVALDPPAEGQDESEVISIQHCPLSRRVPTLCQPLFEAQISSYKRKIFVLSLPLWIYNLNNQSSSQDYWNTTILANPAELILTRRPKRPDRRSLPSDLMVLAADMEPYPGEESIRLR